MTLTLIAGSSFVSAGAVQIIPLSGGANYFKAFNVTQASTTQSTGRGVQFEWYQDSTALDNALMWSKTNSTNAMNLSLITSGGFTYVPNGLNPYPILTGTTISQASSAAATVTNTYSNGDTVRITAVVGMRQISTMVFSITSVTSGGFVLPGLNSSGFAAAATAFNVQKIPNFYPPVNPNYLYVTNISQAANAVITVSTYHNYVAGMKIITEVPSTYGMVQANGVEQTILSVTATTLTTDMNSSGFTAFSFPTSAASVNETRFAVVVPDGQKAYYNFQQGVQYGYNVQQAPFRSSYVVPYMQLAAGALSPAGSTSDLIEWQAFRYGG